MAEPLYIIARPVRIDGTIEPLYYTVSDTWTDRRGEAARFDLDRAIEIGDRWAPIAVWYERVKED